MDVYITHQKIKRFTEQGPFPSRLSKKHDPATQRQNEKQKKQIHPTSWPQSTDVKNLQNEMQYKHSCLQTTDRNKQTSMITNGLIGPQGYDDISFPKEV